MKKLVCYLILAVFLLLPTGTASAELFSGTFVDTRGHWAESEIEIACKQGLMEGAGVNESGIRIFSPEQTADRFQLATVLERAFDLDYGNMRFIKQPKASDYYYDLEEEAWYSEAVLICAINHIFAPMDRFEGEKELTRIEAARSIYNAFQSKGITVPTIMMMPLYDDTGALSQDETNAMVFVSNTGIMKGNDNHFRPYDAIKRAELARVLNQCVKLIEMNPVEVSPTPAVKLECKEIKSDSPPLKIDLNIPVITGLQDEQIQTLINQIVEDEAKQRQKAMTEEAQVIYREMRMEDFSVNWNSTNNSGFIPAEPYQPYEIVSRFNQYYLTRDILSFYVDYYTYTGGAHGMTDRVAYNFDLCTGQQLALRNLFFPDTNYHEIIDERIRSAIELDPEVYFEGDLGFQGIGEDQRFYLENGNLVVYFLQYEIAPYAAGIRTFSVPFLPPKQLTQNSDETAVMQLVADFGSKLKNVSLLAPQDIVKNSLQESYGSLVSPALLAMWQNDVNKAPGRATSSPWPERIEITAMEKLSDSKYQIKGEVITMTSVEMVNGGVAGRSPIMLVAEKIDNRWLINDYRNMDKDDIDWQGDQVNAPASNATLPGEIKLTEPVVLKYYNYFIDHHTLVDNRVFTVNENTLQDDVIYFAFMNTVPPTGKPANIRTQKQIDDVLMKYLGIKPKRYSTGISSVAANGDVQLGSVIEDVVRMHRLLLTNLTVNSDGSRDAVFKLYQIPTERMSTDFDRRIVEGDSAMETYHTMDVRATFTEIAEGDSYYLRFSEFTLTPRQGTFAPPPQEKDYSKMVSRDELKSFHGLSIGMTLEEAKKLLNLPEDAYQHSQADFADYTVVNADGWHYTFRTLPKQESDDRTQYLMSINIRDYLDVIFRDIKLGDAYKDVVKKFPSGQEEGQTRGKPGSYFTRDYRFASTLHNVDIFTGDVHISMLFGRYDTLAWADIYSVDF